MEERMRDFDERPESVMEKKYRELNEQARPAEPPVSPAPPDDYLRMKQWIQDAQARSEQTRNEVEELREELRNQGRKTSGAGWGTAIILLALIGACVYGYGALNGYGSLLAQLPGAQKSIDAINGRLNATENQVRNWAMSWNALTDRVDKVEKDTSANLRAAKDFATIQASKVQQQVQDEMNNRSRSADKKLSELEESQENQNSQLTALQQQVGDAREEAHQQLASAQAQNDRELGNVRNEANQSRDDLNAISRNLDRQRVDFEVNKKQSRELVPGLAFTVLKTDVSHQRVDGYLHLVSEGRMLWIHAQGIEQPMMFHVQANQRQDDKRGYELVFTRVSPDAVVGYVLMPRWPEDGMPAAGYASSPQPTSASLR